MPLRQRVLISLAIALASGLLSYARLCQRGHLAGDFQFPLTAARAVLAGHNPYEVMQQQHDSYPFDSGFFYPLPAALVAIPFCWLDPYVAGALFFGLSSGLLAFGLSKEGWHRFPIFLSAPFYVSASVTQWGPLLIASVFLNWPAYAFLACKPTVGLVPFLFRPSRHGLLAATLITTASILILPSWPLWWLHTILLQGGPRYVVPLLMPGGFLLGLALLSWRAPQGRVLLATAVIPRHVFWYDSLFLWLIPENWKQTLGLSIASWIGYLGWLATLPAIPRDDFAEHVTSCPWQIAFLYLPALVLVLWRRFTPTGRAACTSMS